MIITYPLSPLGQHSYYTSDELSIQLPQLYKVASGLHLDPLAETGCNVPKQGEQQLLICSGQ